MKINSIIFIHLLLLWRTYMWFKAWTKDWNRLSSNSAGAGGDWFLDVCRFVFDTALKDIVFFTNSAPALHFNILSCWNAASSISSFSPNVPAFKSGGSSFCHSIKLVSITTQAVSLPSFLLWHYDMILFCFYIRLAAWCLHQNKVLPLPSWIPSRAEQHELKIHLSLTEVFLFITKNQFLELSHSQMTQKNSDFKLDIVL